MKKPIQTSIFSGMQKSIDGGAQISDCGKYRYSLWRIWDETKPKLLFIMLNPSTADSLKDDPTIKRCIGFAKTLGFGSIYVGNLYALRATDPKELLKADNPNGDNNCAHLISLIGTCDQIICAWGNSGIVKKLQAVPYPEFFKCFIKQFYCLDISIDGTPKHPLYLRSNLKPKFFITTSNRQAILIH